MSQSRRQATYRFSASMICWAIWIHNRASVASPGAICARTLFWKACSWLAAATFCPRSPEAMAAFNGDSLSDDIEPSSCTQALEPLLEINTLLATSGDRSANGLATIFAVGAVLAPPTLVTVILTVADGDVHLPSEAVKAKLSGPV